MKKSLYKITLIKNSKPLIIKKKFNENDLHRYLADCAQNLISIEIHTQEGWKTLEKPSHQEFSPPSKPRAKNRLFKLPQAGFQNHLSFYMGQIALLLDSFMPLDEVIAHCQRTAPPALGAHFEAILKKLKNGNSLSQSFEGFPLSALHHTLIFIGERSGRLQETFHLIAKDLEQKQALKKRLSKALFYPVIVLISIAIAFICAVVVILPEFASLFSQSQLPLITRILLHLSYFFQHYGLFAALALILAFWLHLRFYKMAKKYRFFLDKNRLKLGILGKILLYDNLFHFFNALYILQISGNDLKSSLSLASDTFDNLYLRALLQEAHARLNAAQSFSQSMECLPLDSITLGLLIGGEKSGNLDRMLEACARRYKESCAYLLDKVILWLEPLCSLFLAAMVLFLALGIFLPIWNLQSSEPF